MTRARLLAIARWAALAVVVGAAVWAVASQWDGVTATVAMVHPASLVLSFGFLVAGLLAGTAAWVAMLAGLGPDDGGAGPRVGVLQAAQVCLVGQLGKYVPGSVWAYLLQMELGRRYKLPRARVLLTGLFTAGVGVVCSLVWGTAAIPVVAGQNRSLFWLFGLLPLGLICLHPRVMTWMARTVFRVIRQPEPNLRLPARTVAAVTGWTMLTYLLYGLHLWVLTNSVAEPGLGTLFLTTGAVGLGMTAGLFAFILPSGVGAREAVIVAALSTAITTAQATTIALGSRLMFTAAELALAGVAALLAVRRRPATRAPAEAPGEATDSRLGQAEG